VWIKIKEFLITLWGFFLRDWKAFKGRLMNEYFDALFLCFVLALCVATSLSLMALGESEWFSPKTSHELSFYGNLIGFLSIIFCYVLIKRSEK